MADSRGQQFFYPIDDIENYSNSIVSKNSWIDDYKEAFLEHPHDDSQLTLVLPDDCLVVSGPARLYHTAGGTKQQKDYSNAADKFHIIGFANQISIAETRNVQPLKAIGSRRHIFAATNSPVQISIGRLMILGLNTTRSLYGAACFGDDITKRNSKYSNVTSDPNLASWFSNLEEDVFRVPIGIGFIYNSPATVAGRTKSAGAEYFEVCTIVNKQQALQAGQAFVMEQVQLMADRCVAWPSPMAFESIKNTEEERKKPVRYVSHMGSN